GRAARAARSVRSGVRPHAQSAVRRWRRWVDVQGVDAGGLSTLVRGTRERGMKTVLVTGGAGFMGSNFVHHLYTAYPYYQILFLDLLTYACSVGNLTTEFSGAQAS